MVLVIRGLLDAGVADELKFVRAAGVCAYGTQLLVRVNCAVRKLQRFDLGKKFWVHLRKRLLTAENNFFKEEIILQQFMIMIKACMENIFILLLCSKLNSREKQK